MIRGKTTPGPIEGLAPKPKARLREPVREARRFYHYSERTEEADWGWITTQIYTHVMEKPELGVKNPWTSVNLHPQTKIFRGLFDVICRPIQPSDCPSGLACIRIQITN
jgi:hypothetical protein